MNFVSNDIEEYCIARSHQPSSLCAELHSYTRAHVAMSQMLIGPLEASFLRLLLGLIQARRVLEIGTFTGYSALAMAEALPADGELITLDINPETNKIASDFWQKSPHGKKITAILGPAKTTIPQLSGMFDLVFIDADKTSYAQYLELALPKLSARGLIVLDNALWSGKVLSPSQKDPDSWALDQLNRGLEKRADLQVSLLPIRDGMSLIRKLH